MYAGIDHEDQNVATAAIVTADGRQALAADVHTQQDRLATEAPDIETAWRYLLERTPGTRQGDELIIRAASAQPRLRALYPFPTHGTLKFLSDGPPWSPDSDQLPFLVCGLETYQVYASGYAVLLGETTSPEQAAALLVAHLPPPDDSSS
ncbi:DUF6193 family natural product biosynthesis protein [Dactylosporangium sp. NPDC050588]|uniref:DUF6193 family natural product biosynthesis protein n=1 Tax=Dactylosporangium sp. NPDC050588 TaxID=3157211 RepID=UPI00340BE91D